MGRVFISEKAGENLIRELEAAGHTIFRVKSTDTVYEAISTHPDIYMCKIKDTLIIDETSEMEPDLKSAYRDELERKAEEAESGAIIPAARSELLSGYIIYEMGQIGYEYPYDVAYNAISTDKFFIHNTKYTSASLLDYARNAGLEIINVKQGYAKCSCVVVADNAIITADSGIVKSCLAYNEMICEEYENNPEEQSLRRIDVLKIEKGHVALEGFDYGFIGGTSGEIDSVIYFNGNLAAHPDCEKIIDFVKTHGKEVRYFDDYELTDIGSIIYLP